MAEHDAIPLEVSGRSGRNDVLGSAGDERPYGAYRV
jgi:hypothetical protein